MTLAGFKSSNHPQQTAKRGANDAVDDRGTDPEFIATLEERFGKFHLDVAAAPHNAKAGWYYTQKDDGLQMPWTRAHWQGRTCVMCNGSGRDFAYILAEPRGAGIRTVESKAETDGPCRACAGHGREPAMGDIGVSRVWCNPPYSDIRTWVQKAWDEWSAGGLDLIVMLLPANRVEQGWWQDLVEPFRDKPGSPLRVEFLPGRMRFIRPDWTPGPKGDRPPFGCCLLIWESR